MEGNLFFNFIILCRCFIVLARNLSAMSTRNKEQEFLLFFCFYRDASKLLILLHVFAPGFFNAVLYQIKNIAFYS